MSEVTIAKLIYGTIALIAGITVGVVVAIFLAVLRFFEVLISFPLEIYKTLLQRKVSVRTATRCGIAI